jgi:hypothetical protein
MRIRGDIKLDVGDETINLVPSFLNLMEIEDRCDPETIFTLVAKMEKQEVKAKDLVAILHAGTGYPNKDTGDWTSKYELNEFGQLCLEAGGIVGLLAPAMELLTSLLISMKPKDEEEIKKKPTASKRARKTTASRGQTTSK